MKEARRREPDRWQTRLSFSSTRLLDDPTKSVEQTVDQPVANIHGYRLSNHVDPPGTTGKV
jgi:hypothetical protein